MRFTDQIRTAIDNARDVWADRDLHIANLKEIAKATPGKFREAPARQKKAVIAAVITILGLQAILLFANVF